MNMDAKQLQLKLLTEKDFPALFDFEQRNAEYFQDYVPARPESYHSFDSFCVTQTELLAEQLQGKAYFYVAYQRNSIIARMNINAINSDISSGDIGYRTDKSVQGKGVARLAVEQLIIEAIKKGLKELTATVAHMNPASEKVLINNGFVYLRTEQDAYELNGISLHFRYFIKQLH